MNEKNENRRDRALTVIGILLCAVLLPIFLVNSTLLVKSFTQKDSVPSFGGYVPMIVLSDSMYPEIEAGDIVICRRTAAEEIRTGDVISFYDPDGNGISVVTHRVAEITEQNGITAFRTKGDNNNAADRSLVTADKLVARYTGKRIAGAGNVAMFMQTSTGLLVCFVVPLVLLIGYDLLRRRSYEKQQAADTEELRAELERLRSLQEKMKEA